MNKKLKEELKSKTTDELIKELRDMRSEASKMAFDIKTGKLENTNAFYRKKKDIARVLTILSQRPLKGETDVV